MDLRHLVH